MDADNVSIGSKILGRISAIYGNEGDFVTSRDRFLRILTATDLISQRNQSLDTYKPRQWPTWFSLKQNTARTRKALKFWRSVLNGHTEDLNRAKSQSEGGVITAEQFDHIKKGI